MQRTMKSQKPIWLGMLVLALLTLTVVLSHLNPVSAQTPINIFTDFNSFLVASGPVAEIDFENLPHSASSRPDNSRTEFIPNPLILQGLTFTDPDVLRTAFCASATCRADPHN